ncbi:hypothetical protein HHK36_001632 [Tetracentron sinense]|uniref:Uncharacterized protein n=1 Tax=Tetracentron sinense TaxID=13715 RepID=A0A834ZXM0_TETSI|nr:hypothetical protein HHK36_001632 [Tetracentron sinense]
MHCDNHSKTVMVSGSQFIDLDSIPHEFFPLSIMTAAEMVALKTNLKTDLSKAIVRKEMEKSEMNKQWKNIDRNSDEVKKFLADWSKVKYTVPVAKKRGPPRRLEGQKAKRQRMDSGAMQDCADILKKLMLIHLNGMEKDQNLHGRNSNKKQMETHDMRQGYHKIPASHMLPKKSLSSEEKKKLRKDLLEMSKGKIFRSLGLMMRPCGSGKVSKELFGCKSYTFVRSSPFSLFESCLIKITGKAYCNCKLLWTRLCTEGPTQRSNRHACGSVNIKLLMSFGTCRMGSCGKTTCRCHRRNNSTQNSSSGMCSERLLGGDNHACRDGALSLNHLANDKSTAQNCNKSNPDSDGAVRCKDPLYDGLQSPHKALCIVKLKRRFADTILKAQEKTQSDNVSVMHQEKERLERKKHEAKARLNAEIRAAELRLQQEREREAARMAIQKLVFCYSFEFNFFTKV